MRPHLLMLLVAATAVMSWAQLAEPGELLLAADFSLVAELTKERRPLQPGWQVRVAHGHWRATTDGVASSWTQGHSPVLVLEGEFGDVVVDLEFRYRAEPGKWAACRISATNPQLYPRAYAASVWANADFDSRARGLQIENDVWGGPITRVGYKQAAFAPDTWHRLRLEIVGDTASAECNGVRVTGTHEKFGLPKTSLWLATGQSPHELRQVRVYAARGRPTTRGKSGSN